jgi:GDPmannose 4,6-dehydratase
MDRVLITGVRGQIASFLAEQLLAEGHEVVGLTRSPDDALPDGIERARGSLEPGAGIEALVRENGALTAIVHLASLTSMARSWQEPMLTFDLNARAAVALVFAARDARVRIVHASSAEIFGRAATPIQDEQTPLDPVSPYGIAKAAAHLAIRFGRREYKAPMSNLIFYLGESLRRGPDFVMRKITRGVAAIAAGREKHIALGNTSAVRDFCHAKDLAAAAKLLALGAKPGDYVCASGEGHAIKDIVDTACRLAHLDPADCVRTDPSLFRPNDIPSLVGNGSALRALGWAPTVSFEALVGELLDHEMREAKARGPHEQ